MLHLVGLIQIKYVRLITHVVNAFKNSFPLFHKAVSGGVENFVNFDGV